MAGLSRSSAATALEIRDAVVHFAEAAADFAGKIHDDDGESFCVDLGDPVKVAVPQCEGLGVPDGADRGGSGLNVDELHFAECGAFGKDGQPFQGGACPP